MPSERIHRMQAEQNERLARGLVLLSPQLMDWGTTACFYTALHLVDSYLLDLEFTLKITQNAKIGFGVGCIQLETNIAS